MRDIRVIEGGKQTYAIVTGATMDGYISTMIYKQTASAAADELVYLNQAKTYASGDNHHQKIVKMAESDFVAMISNWTPPKQKRKRGKK